MTRKGIPRITQGNPTKLMGEVPSNRPAVAGFFCSHVEPKELTEAAANQQMLGTALPRRPRFAPLATEIRT
jgi:hypothetical protein